MNQLPTDSEFLDDLYDRFKDDEWVTRREQYVKTVDLIEATRQAITEGVGGEADSTAVSEAIQEALTPSQLFRGRFIGMLRGLALHILKPFRAQLENVPVGCLPTRMLNGAAFSTPRGGAVIVLDQGVITQLAVLVRSYFAYYTWYAAEAYCRDHSQADFGKAIQLLAAFSVLGDLEYLRKITIWECPSRPRNDQVIEIFAMGIEVAILLHEYGHVVLGHLGSCRMLPLRLEPAGNLTIYANSQAQEFEADGFAFKHMQEGMRPGLDASDVGFSFGLLFNFFHLGELISPPIIPTHPPALLRWERIKTLAGIPSKPGAWANELDAFFAPLSDGLKLPGSRP